MSWIYQGVMDGLQWAGIISLALAQTKLAKKYSELDDRQTKLGRIVHDLAQTGSRLARAVHLIAKKIGA